MFPTAFVNSAGFSEPVRKLHGRPRTVHPQNPTRAARVCWANLAIGRHARGDAPGSSMAAPLGLLTGIDSGLSPEGAAIHEPWATPRAARAAAVHWE